MKNNKSKKEKKDAFFIRLLNKLLKLDCLKLLELSLGWVKGMSIKLAFYERKKEENKNGS